MANASIAIFTKVGGFKNIHRITYEVNHIHYKDPLNNLDNKLENYLIKNMIN